MHFFAVSQKCIHFAPLCHLAFILAFFPVGDPPNAIIVNDPEVKEAGINFTKFLIHVGPCVVIVAIVDFFVLKFLYRKLEMTDEDAEIRQASFLRTDGININAIHPLNLFC